VQGAEGVEGHRAVAIPAGPGCQVFGGQDLAQVAGQGGLARVGEVIPQQFAILLDQGAAGADYHRLGPGLERRPPSVDVPAHEGPRLLRRPQVLADRPTAAGARGTQQWLYGISGGS